jgi:hypothetical protein
MPYNDLIDGDRYYEGKPLTYESSIILTGKNDQDAVIAFGLGLVRGSADDFLEIPDGTGGTFMGVAVETNTIEKRAGYSIDANGKMGWPIDYDMSYMRRGIIPVPIDSDCVQGGAVYLIHTASSGQVPGHFRKDANTDQADLVANAVFWKTLSAAGVGLIRINQP